MWGLGIIRSALRALGLLLIVASTAQAQQVSYQEFGGYHLDMAVQALRTEAENAAIGFAADLLKNPAEIFHTNCSLGAISAGTCNQGRTTGWLFDLSPNIQTNTGSEDAFQSIVGKISGNFMVFSLEKLEFSPVPLPDLSKPLHVFPLSAGVETTRNADVLNAVAEIGYVPYHLGSRGQFGDNQLRLGINPRVGFFAQGGKRVRDDAEFDIGGRADESAEQDGDAIGRLKSIFSMQLNFPMTLMGFRTGLVIEPTATGWYDLINNDVYYSLELSTSIVLLDTGTERKTLWEFTVQKGSGEPLFNEGTQFGTGLKLVY